MKKAFSKIIAGTALSGSMLAQTSLTGPSTAHSPYMVPVVAGSTMTSILTVKDSVSGYMLCGLGDGLGAFDNGGGTFTLLMNHEMGTTQGAVRAHGSTGAFVSKWVINKSNLSVVSGEDLIKDVYLWTGATYTMYNAATTSTLTRFGRFCAADLPEVSAFYNAATGKGTQARIFMNGEENGNTGRAFGHIATGPAAGSSYELPHMGKFSWENAVPSPYASDKTIVAGLDDATPGQIYMYIGSKQTTGTDIEKAGLFGGSLYGVAVLGLVNEINAGIPAPETVFNLIDLGLVHNLSGSTLNTNSNNAGVTSFLRPEDGAWDPNRPSDFYFVTTNSFSAPSRLWRLRFKDINHPELGGTVTVILNGTEGQKMMDNVVMDNHGHIFLQEDPGGQSYTAKVHQYDVFNDTMIVVCDEDTTRFKTGGANYLTQDEEITGMIDMQGILGAGWFIVFDQAHYSIPGPAVDGGQLLAFYNPQVAASNPEINVTGNAVAIPAGNATVSLTDNTHFGALNLGTVTSRTFLIHNTNAGRLIVSDIRLEGAQTGDFTLSAPIMPFTLSGNASKSISVGFAPTVQGARNATITIVSSDWDEKTYSYAISGTGAVAEISLEGNNNAISDNGSATSPSNNTDFGSVPYNTPATRVFSIRNTGTGTLTVSGIQVCGPNSPLYSIMSGPQFPLYLSGGNTATFAVQYLSPSPGTHYAIVNVINSDSDEQAYDFTLKGESLLDIGSQESSIDLAPLLIYPNPTSQEVTVSFGTASPETTQVLVYDLHGKIVLTTTHKLSAGLNELRLSTIGLSDGHYIVELRGKTTVHHAKLLIAH